MRLLAPAILACTAAPAFSQTISVTSPDPQLGNVVSAPTGDTIFRVSPSASTVTVAGGTGYRVSGGTTRAVVTVTCPNVGACNTKDVDVTISAIGSPTKRARALTNFTVSNGTATIKVPPGVSGTNPITFKLNPVGRSSTKYFYLGMDFPIAGDSSGLPTGVATSNFLINATAASVNISANGQAVATVFRPITIGLTSNLSFGTVSRPFAGTGTVSLDSATGERALTGQGVQGILAAPVRAAYLVSGEGGQVFSISVPPTFTMTGATDTLTVTTNNNAAGTQVLSGSLGSAGSRAFHVGGSFPLNSSTGLGTYSGSFAVTVQYN
jgi:hypothetical protein